MEPRLRTAAKFPPPWKLNQFPEGFGERIARSIILRIATGATSIEGPEFERIFAESIGAAWRPSNVGLDDIVLRDTAWGAKSVKNASPHAITKVRLISGRNDPKFSFGFRAEDPEELGRQVLQIWNGRVDQISKNYRHLRSIVLVKPTTFAKPSLDFSVFEMATETFDVDEFRWESNQRGNLEGFVKSSGEHCFTWQPHGAQFTILHPIPTDIVKLRIKTPVPITSDGLLAAVGFERSWIELL